jgi:hypothetical protein
MGHLKPAESQTHQDVNAANMIPHLEKLRMFSPFLSKGHYATPDSAWQFINNLSVNIVKIGK